MKYKYIYIYYLSLWEDNSCYEKTSLKQKEKEHRVVPIWSFLYFLCEKESQGTCAMEVEWFMYSLFHSQLDTRKLVSKTTNIGDS